MVTTLYRGVAGKTLGSKLEALGLSTDFAGGVLLARAMEGGIRFGLGATIATTKDVLGEDRRPGARWRIIWATITNWAREPRPLGRKVELADTVLETALPDYSFRDFWLHQMRWARNVKDRRPGAVFRTDRDVRSGLGDSGGNGAAVRSGGPGRCWRSRPLRALPRQSWSEAAC